MLKFSKISRLGILIMLLSSVVSIAEDEKEILIDFEQKGDIKSCRVNYGWDMKINSEAAHDGNLGLAIIQGEKSQKSLYSAVRIKIPSNINIKEYPPGSKIEFWTRVTGNKNKISGVFQVVSSGGEKSPGRGFSYSPQWVKQAFYLPRNLKEMKGNLWILIGYGTSKISSSSIQMHIDDIRFIRSGNIYEPSKQILINGGFEEGLMGWSIHKAKEEYKCEVNKDKHFGGK